MSRDATVIAFRQPDDVDDPLTELAMRRAPKKSHRVAIPDIDHAERRGGTERKVVVAVVRGGRSSPLLERPQRIAISERSKQESAGRRSGTRRCPGNFRRYRSAAPPDRISTGNARVHRRGSLCRMVSRL